MDPIYFRDPGTDGVGVAFVSDIGREAIDGPVLATAKRATWAERLGLARIVAVHQVHGRDVVIVDHGYLHRRGEQPQADALVTCLRAHPPVAISVHTADCVPVVLADADSGIVAAVHAGRPGVVVGVVPATIIAMRELGARNLEAWIGPSVCGRCYEVPEQMRAEIVAKYPAAYATTAWGTPAVDIAAAVGMQLSAEGVRITRLPHCTREDASLPSYRRDGAAAGRLGAIIWLA